MSFAALARACTTVVGRVGPTDPPPGELVELAEKAVGPIASATAPVSVLAAKARAASVARSNSWDRGVGAGTPSDPSWARFSEVPATRLPRSSSRALRSSEAVLSRTRCIVEESIVDSSMTGMTSAT